MKVPKSHGRLRRIGGPLAVVASALVVAWAVRAWSGPGADPDLIWRQAQADLQADRIDRAEAALARLARLRAPTAADRMLRAQTAIAAKHGDEAIAELSRIPDDDRLGPQARMLAGQVELRRDRVRSAERFFRAAVALDPKLVQAHREFIYIYGILVRRRELYAEFLALSKLVPLTFKNAFDWSITRNSNWEPNELVEMLRRYVAADPEDRWSRLAFAEYLRQVGRHDDAEAALAPLPATDPDARATRVRIALDRGHDDAAEALLAGGPEDHAELARLRGRIALTRRDGPAALKHFRAADRAEPDYRDTLFGLGQALILVGDTAAAAPYLAAARKIDAIGTLLQLSMIPSHEHDLKLLLALGSACEKARRYPEARAWYHLALEADPLNADTQKALFRLKGLDDVPAGKESQAPP